MLDCKRKRVEYFPVFDGVGYIDGHQVEMRPRCALSNGLVSINPRLFGFYSKDHSILGVKFKLLPLEEEIKIFYRH